VLAKLSAEFIGTFWLVLGGCGSAVLAAAFPDVGIGLHGVSLAFGLTMLSGAYALGPISGGHFNPAVSVGLWAGGRVPCDVHAAPSPRGTVNAKAVDVGRR
jgi:aquaporin Z